MRVDALVSEWRPDALLVGLPLNMDDTLSEMVDAREAFREDASARAITSTWNSSTNA